MAARQLNNAEQVQRVHQIRTVLPAHAGVLQSAGVVHLHSSASCGLRQFESSTAGGGIPGPHVPSHSRGHVSHVELTCSVAAPQYMTEATFNWRMVKNICAELHVYDEVTTWLGFLDIV